MKKIEFINDSAPYLSAENLNLLQDNVENAINQLQDNVEDDIEESKLEVYSTSEQRIGIWIDGKPLYRKVISGTTSAKDGDNLAIDTSILNIKELTNLYGFIGYTSNSTFEVGSMLPINAYYDNTHFSVFYYYSNQKKIFCYAGLTSLPFILTIEYTKTTD